MGDDCQQWCERIKATTGQQQCEARHSPVADCEGVVEGVAVQDEPNEGVCDLVRSGVTDCEAVTAAVPEVDGCTEFDGVHDGEGSANTPAHTVALRS